MKIIRRTVGTVDVCTPQEALVDDNAAQFIETLKTYLNGPSAALEGLARIADELAERSQQLKLAEAAPTCREILSLTGLSSRFQFFDSVDAAVRSFL